MPPGSQDRRILKVLGDYVTVVGNESKE
jgi:hypothetical protein